jgi:RNA polymerase sigma factor (sigma-70 family)
MKATMQQLKESRAYLMRYYKDRRVSRADAEDLAQDAMLRRLRTRVEVRYERVYLQHIAKSVFLTRAEVNNTQARVAKALKVFVNLARPHAPDVLQQVAAESELRHVLLVIQRMPPKRQQVLALRKVYGFSQAEIAKRMGISENTVEHHLKKAIPELNRAVGLP